MCADINTLAPQTCTQTTPRCTSGPFAPPSLSLPHRPFFFFFSLFFAFWTRSKMMILFFCLFSLFF